MAPASRPPWVAGAAAAVIAVAALTAGALLLSEPAGRPNGPDHDAAAAGSLVNAYRRSLTATYSVERLFTRRVRGGDRFSASTVVNQRPPERLTTSETSVDGILDGHTVGCVRVEGDAWRCRRGGPADFDRDVAEETAQLRSLVTGPRSRRWYSVRLVAGCYRLRLVRPVLAPPYGRDATMCFDTDSGALQRVEIRRPEAVDVTVATRVSSEVDDAALLLPAPVTTEPER